MTNATTLIVLLLVGLVAVTTVAHEVQPLDSHQPSAIADDEPYKTALCSGLSQFDRTKSCEQWVVTMNSECDALTDKVQRDACSTYVMLAMLACPNDPDSKITMDTFISAQQHKLGCATAAAAITVRQTPTSPACTMPKYTVTADADAVVVTWDASGSNNSADRFEYSVSAITASGIIQYDMGSVVLSSGNARFAEGLPYGHRVAMNFARTCANEGSKSATAYATAVSKQPGSVTSKEMECTALPATFIPTHVTATKVGDSVHFSWTKGAAMGQYPDVTMHVLAQFVLSDSTTSIHMTSALLTTGCDAGIDFAIPAGSKSVHLFTWLGNEPNVECTSHDGFFQKTINL